MCALSCLAVCVTICFYTSVLLFMSYKLYISDAVLAERYQTDVLFIYADILFIYVKFIK